jgi:hypothetical protein
MGRAVYRDPRKQWHRIGFSTDLNVAKKAAAEFAPKFQEVKVKPSTKHGRKGYTVWEYGV